MKQLRKAICWLLCAVILTGAVVCSGGKGTSGQKVAAVKAQQEKSLLTLNQLTLLTRRELRANLAQRLYYFRLW